MHWLQISFCFCLLTTALSEDNLQCAVDERVNLALDTYSVIEPSELFEREDVTTENDCYKSCCDRIENGDGCNAATFFKEGSKFYCFNARCTPFHSCEFVDFPFALSARVAIFNTSVDFDEKEEETAAGNTTGQVNGTISQTANDETPEEEMEEEVEELFKANNENDTWNIEYDDYEYSTTTYGYYDGFNSQGQETNEGNTIENSPGGDETSTAGDEVNTSQGGEGISQDQEGETHDESNDQSDAIKPHLAHGNSGIYGPNEVTDFDYSNTPLIVIGVVVTVLFLLLLLVFVGRKMILSDRLKYRPLRDSFPAANAYHDANSYHDLEQ